MARAAGSPFARRYFAQNDNLVKAHDPYVLMAARDVQMRVHALIGQNYYKGWSPAAYASFCVSIVKRYGPSGSLWNAHPELKRYAVTTFELLNEPWYPNKDPRVYAAFVKPALAAIKKLRIPGVKVIVSVAGKGAVRGVSWIKGLYKSIRNLNTVAHGFAVHPYWNGKSPSAPSKSKERPFSYMDSIRAAVDCRGGKTKGLYVTEYGSSTFEGAQGVTREEQAAYLKSFLAAVKANKYGWNVKLFSIYDLKSFDPLDYWNPNAKESLKQREANFGLLDKDGNPKPAYFVYKSYAGIKNAPKRKPRSSMKGKAIYGSCVKRKPAAQKNKASKRPLGGGEA
jgi:hypothetical protein